MKRYLRSSGATDALDLDIIITYVPETEGEKSSVAATDILPVVIDRKKRIIDPVAKVSYDAFVEMVLETITAYGFHIFEEFKKTSKSFPGTSQYMWIARKKEVESGDIPRLIRLRISEHEQDLANELKKNKANKERKEANSLKLPKTKKTQRFVPNHLVVTELKVNGAKCTTYEEALHVVEAEVRRYLSEKGEDLTPYKGPMW